MPNNNENVAEEKKTEKTKHMPGHLILTPVQLKEKRRRMRLAVWAYAYEFENVSLVPDAVFDEEAKLVNLDVETDMPHLDAWFKANFNPHTGMWIHTHPELERIKDIALNSIELEGQCL
jgi:hypothetical protein